MQCNEIAIALLKSLAFIMVQVRSTAQTGDREQGRESLRRLQAKVPDLQL